MSKYAEVMKQADETTLASSGQGTHGHEVSKARGIKARKLRESNGLTRPILADMINRSERTIFRWETEGISEDNFRLIEDGIDASKTAQARGASGFSRLSTEALRTASTLDLALELVSRARKIEDRNRGLDNIKRTLEEEGFGYLLPKDF